MSSKKKDSAANDEGKRALVPKLRFPEFRGAEAWDMTPLGELGKIVTGKTPSTKEYDLWGGTILFITPTDITDDEKYQHTTQRTVVATTGQKVLPPGSVVYTCIASIGKMALTVVPSVTNQQINTVVPNSRTAREFIYYSLANLTPWIKSIPATSTLPIINKTQFSGFIIPHPREKAEQEKIAECLSSVDELIAAQARKIDALKSHKKGLMQQLFPREGETQPQLRFPEFRSDEEWIEKPLNEISENRDNQRVPITSSARKSGDVPYYGASGIVDYVDGFIFDEDLLCISEDGANLVARTYPIAFPISGKTWVNNHAHVLKFENACTQKFVEVYLNSIKLDDFITGMAQPKLNKAMLDRIPIPHPSISEQQRIASCLTSLDVLITAETQKLETLKLHKRGLMQQLFPPTLETHASAVTERATLMRIHECLLEIGGAS